jgi:hypothetical protein
VWREGRTAEVPWEDGRRSCSATAGCWLSSPLCNRSTIRGINKLSALVGVSSRGGQHDHMGWTAACHDTRQDTTHATPEEKNIAHRTTSVRRNLQEIRTRRGVCLLHLNARCQQWPPVGGDAEPCEWRARLSSPPCVQQYQRHQGVTLREPTPSQRQSTTGHLHTHTPHLRASLPVTPPFRSRSVPRYT